MAWVRVDDGFMAHPKLAALLGDPDVWGKAVALWLAASCWSSKYATDGKIPEKILKILVPFRPKVAAESLVKCGLWAFDPSTKTYTIHDFLDYNPSSEQRRVVREKNRERKRKWANAHKIQETRKPDSESGQGGDPGSRNGVTDALVTSPGTRSVTHQVTHSEQRSYARARSPSPTPKDLSLASQEASSQATGGQETAANQPETQDKSPGRREQKAKTPDPRVLPLLDAWSRLYREATGRDYLPHHARDCAAIRHMLAALEHSQSPPPDPVGEVERRFRVALSQPFYRGPAGHLGTVWSHFSGLASPPSNSATLGSVRPSETRPAETRIHRYQPTETESTT